MADSTLIEECMGVTTMKYVKAVRPERMAGAGIPDFHQCSFGSMGRSPGGIKGEITVIMDGTGTRTIGQKPRKNGYT